MSFFVLKKHKIVWVVKMNLSELQRKEIKEILKELRKINPYIDKNIYRSTEKVNLQTILSFQNGEKIESVLNQKKEEHF